MTFRCVSSPVAVALRCGGAGWLCPVQQLPGVAAQGTPAPTNKGEIRAEALSLWVASPRHSFQPPETKASRTPSPERHGTLDA
ncbi:hypothetical protein SAMN05661093_08599 [Kibdelosporangium aridum]|uniref:Uncharacterized protein n=1 Tax=Kibdelosporangium aridum TaxID=2030 RepID=A0A1Y5Y5E4_KIBAR|nr:hypothetical protein SAMN05661093_08599 [Kibdelosporangium aridum]